MRRRHYLKQLTLAATVGSLAIVLSIGASKPSIANAQSSSQRHDIRQGLPGRRISGGSRSPISACLTTPNQPVVAIMPRNNIGLTLSEHPTFWFSLPAVNLDKTLEFRLQDQTGNLIYKQSFAASGEAGIASLSLPNTSTPLTIEKNYQWYLSVVCDPDNRSEDLLVAGWIRRVQAPKFLSDTQIANATWQERLQAYKTSNLWFETLATLTEFSRMPSLDSATAQKVSEQWQELLDSADLTQVGLMPFSNQPIQPLNTL